MADDRTSLTFEAPTSERSEAVLIFKGSFLIKPCSSFKIPTSPLVFSRKHKSSEEEEVSEINRNSSGLLMYFMEQVLYLDGSQRDIGSPRRASIRSFHSSTFENDRLKTCCTPSSYFQKRFTESS